MKQNTILTVFMILLAAICYSQSHLLPIIVHCTHFGLRTFWITITFWLVIFCIAQLLDFTVFGSYSVSIFSLLDCCSVWIMLFLDHAFLDCTFFGLYIFWIAQILNITLFGLLSLCIKQFMDCKLLGLHTFWTAQFLNCSDLGSCSFWISNFTQISIFRKRVMF